jgi:hypothetical protein
MTRLKNYKKSVVLVFFLFQNRGGQSRLIQNKIFKLCFVSKKRTVYFPVIFSFTFLPTQMLFYTMATPTLKWPARSAPKTTGDTPMSSDNEGPNPNPNDTPTFFHNQALQFQFYLFHGHTNVTRHNANNSLAGWASYQRSKMGIVNKYDPKWNQLLNGIGFCSFPPQTPNQVFKNHLVSYTALRGPRNTITPKKANNKALHGWWEYWRQEGKQCLQGGAVKSKTMPDAPCYS